MKTLTIYRADILAIKLFAAAFMLSLFLPNKLSAQAPQYQFQTVGKPIADHIPLSGVAMRNTDQKSQWLYFPDDFGGSVPANMVINKIYFEANPSRGPVTLENFQISLGQDSHIVSLDSAVWETGLLPARDSAQFIVPPINQRQWFSVELDHPFFYDPNLPLIVEASITSTPDMVMLLSNGRPLNKPSYSGFTQNYGGTFDSVPNTTRLNSYSFGFDLIPAPVPNDVGIARLDSPAIYCGTGMQDVYVTIQNYGSNQVDSLDLYWEVNGVSQGSVSYNTPFGGDSLPMRALFKLGTYNFQGYDVIKVYTSMPNGVNDTVNTNDTLVSTVRSALNGTYTVNSSLAESVTNFTSLSSLSSTLNEVGVCGPVLINVAAAVYNDAIHLKEVPNSSAINHIVIDGGDSSQTIVTQDGSMFFSTLTLEKTNHVKVQNMSFINTGSRGNAVTFVNTMHDTLSSCISRVNTNGSSNSEVYSFVFSGSASSNNNTISHYNVVQNNRIIGGSNGLRLVGDNNEMSKYNQFYNNVIDSARAYGAYFTYQDSLDFIDNYVNTYDNNGLDGIKIDESNNFHIKQNKIYGNRRALEISGRTVYDSTERKNQVVNNVFYGRNSFPAVQFSNISSVDFWHNSIYAEGGIPALQINNITTSISISGFDVRNNILTSENGPALAMQLHAGVTDSMVFLKLDHNIYYKYNGIGLIRVQIGTNRVTHRDLTAYQLAAPYLNSNSYQGDPEFVNLINPTDLNIKGSYPDEKGDNSVGVTVDIEGNVRPNPGATNVDIGAYEFYPSFCYQPEDIKIKNITNTSIDLSWRKDTVNTGHLMFGYVIVPCGNSPYSDTTVLTSLDSLTASGLSAGSCYELYVRDICGRADSSVWSAPMKFYTASTIPYFEDYESFASNITENPWPKGWSSYKTHNMLPSWSSKSGPAITTATGPGMDHTKGSVGDSTGKYIYLGTTFSASALNTTADFISPLIYVDSSLTSFELSYWYHAYGSGVNGMDVYIRSNGNDRLVNSFQGQQQSSKFAPWLKDSVVVAGYHGKIINVVFRGKNGINSQGGSSATGIIGIDDVAINVGPTCPPPFDFSSANPTDSSIDISWSSLGSAVSLEYGVAGFSRGNGTVVTGITSSTANISGIFPNVVYDVYLQDSCDVNDVSVVSGPFKFNIETVNCDAFDNYGNRNIDPQSTLFEGWEGDAGDAEVSSEQSSSAPYSLKVHNSGPNSTSDITANVGVYDSAKWVVSFDFYLPTGNGGYYNLLHNYKNNTSPEIAFEVWLDQSGTAYVEEGVNGNDTLGVYNFTVNAWNKVEHIIDLDNDTAYIEVNGIPTNVGWKFSLDSANFGNQFSAVSFHSIANGSQVPLTYYDNFCISTFTPVPYYPIGTINTEDANGIADSVNLTAWTSGTVVGVNLNAGNGLGFTIIDMSSNAQEGIFIFNSDDVSNYSVSEGDSIKVRGVIEQFNGLTQMVAHTIEIISRNNAIPTPRVVSTLNESTESQYLEIQKFVLLDSSGVGSYSMRAYNGTDTITINISAQTNVSDSLADINNSLVARDTICLLLGVGGQNDPSNTPPYTNGYHITPMYYSDITVCKDVTIGVQKVQVANASLTFYPNPTTASFTIATSGLENDNATIIIRDISGKVIVRENIANSSNPFKKQYSLEGKAKGLYFISIIDGEKQITKKLILQ